MVLADRRYTGNVHRLAAHLFLGLDLSRSRGVYACHHCDTPACFNPEHLFLGTPKDNSDDCKAKGRERHQSGEDNGGGGKLATADIPEIRRLHLSAGLSQSEIARRFGVHHSMVNRIISGKAWAHVA